MKHETLPTYNEALTPRRLGRKVRCRMGQERGKAGRPLAGWFTPVAIAHWWSSPDRGAHSMPSLGVGSGVNVATAIHLPLTSADN